MVEAEKNKRRQIAGKLIRDIVLAFSSMERPTQFRDDFIPGGDELMPGGVSLNDRLDLEIAVMDQFDITCEDLWMEGAYLTDEAYAYFLPAQLIESIIADDPSSPSINLETRNRIAEILTADQRRAVADYIRYFYEEMYEDSEDVAPYMVD
jgi:hypothetical protein